MKLSYEVVRVYIIFLSACPIYFKDKSREFASKIYKFVPYMIPLFKSIAMKVFSHQKSFSVCKSMMAIFCFKSQNFQNNKINEAP